MYTWSRQRGPTSTASGIPAPMETGLAAGEDRPWTGDTLNGSATRGARGVMLGHMRKGDEISTHCRHFRGRAAGDTKTAEHRRQVAPKAAGGGTPPIFGLCYNEGRSEER